MYGSGSGEVFFKEVDLTKCHKTQNLQDNAASSLSAVLTLLVDPSDDSVRRFVNVTAYTVCVA
jgi:hypothetical protein